MPSVGDLRICRPGAPGVQKSLLDLPDDLLRIILRKVIEGICKERRVGFCVKARLQTLLVCKQFLAYAKEVPLSLCSEGGLDVEECLSLGCDHQMDLWLPPKMQRLEITLHPRLFDNNRWTVGHGWGADAAEVVHSYTDSDLEWVLRAPMSWGEATITGVECEDDPGAALQLGRPTWARMLRGLTQLGTLIVQGKPSRLEPDQEGAYPNQLMGLLDFEREWPTGLTLKNLHAKSAFVPFDLAVRDAELLQFSEAVVLLTQARSAGELLDFLLRGRARAVRFRARFRKGLRTRFTFVGPGLGPQGLTPLDLAASAKSLAYVLDVAVSELCGGARGDGCCMEFRLVARRKEE